MADPTARPAVERLPAGSVPTEPLRALAVSPDGASLAVISGQDLFVLDPASGEVRWAYTSRLHHFDLWFSPDSARLVVLGYGEVHAFDAATGDWLRGVAEAWTTQADRLSASADGALLLAHLHDRLLLLDAETLQERARWGCTTGDSDHRVRFRDADLHPSGAWVAWVSGDYGETTGTVVRVGEDAPVAAFDRVERVRFTAEGDRIVVDRGHPHGAEVLPWPAAGGRGLRRLGPTQTGRPLGGPSASSVAPPSGRPGGRSEAAPPSFWWPSFDRARFWPGGALLLRGAGTTVLAPDSPEERWTGANHEAPRDVAVHPGAGLYYTAHEAWIGRRRLANGGLIDVFPIRRGTWVRAAALAGDHLAVGDRDGRVAVWDLAGPRRITLADPGPSCVPGAKVERDSVGWVRGLCFDGDRLWAIADKGAFAWTGWTDLDRPPDAAAEGVGLPELWAPSRRRVVCKEGDDFVVVELPGIEVGRVPRPGAGGWRHPVANPDASILYGGEADDARSVVSAWETASGTEIGVLEVDGHAEILLADEVGVWMSVTAPDEADEDGGVDRFVARWDPRAGAVVELLPPREEGSPTGPLLDERHVVVSTWHDGLRIVDRGTGAVVLALGRDGGRDVLAWDGERLVTGDDRGRVQVWSVSSGRRLAELGSGPFGSWWAVGPTGETRWEPGPMAWRST